MGFLKVVAVLALAACACQKFKKRTTSGRKTITDDFSDKF